MHRVRLIHWSEAEAAEKVGLLEVAGYEVAYDPLSDAARKKWKTETPVAIVIDLSRLPMQGRDVGIAFRHHKATRLVPLVFVGGEPEKVARIRQMLPDAVYTTWGRIRTALRKAIAKPPSVPVKPASVLAGYSGTPLAKKLGIKPNSVVALVNAPPNFEKLLSDLPAGATLRQTRGRRNLTIWFARSREEFEPNIQPMAKLAEQGPLWIAWPKQTSSLSSDLTQAAVRKTGLANGLVDYKICAIDATWSGLLFTRRSE